MDTQKMAAYQRLCFVVACLLAGTAGFELPPTAWDGELPLLETRRDVDSYLNTMEQMFRVEMNKEFMKQYTKRSADAGVLQTQIDRLGKPNVRRGIYVSATDFFNLDGSNYTVIAQRTLGTSYIALVRRSTKGKLEFEQKAHFSVKSFVDQQYRATYQASLQQRVTRLKAHVFGGQVFIMTELAGGRTLLFLVSDPSRSWTPKYQDSVLSPDEVASDFVFFEQTGQLYVIVTVSHQRRGQALITATTSYIYRLKNGIKWLQLHTLPTAGGATSVTTYTDQRWTYIVIGLNSTRSVMYRLHWETSALELFQFLPASHVTAVEAFTHHTQTYVLLVNQYGGASVFWWTSDQLFPWQTLSTGDSDLGHVQFGHVGYFYNGESFIYLVSETKIFFFTTFSSQTGHYSLATNHTLAATASIHHVQMTRVGRDGYYLLVSVKTPSSVDWKDYPVVVREAAGSQRAAAPHSPGSDELISCLDKADSMIQLLDKQLDILLQLADSVFVQNCDRNLTGKVIVNGTLTITGEADVTALEIVSNQPSDGDDDVRMDVSEVKAQIVQCEDSIRDIETGMQNVLTKSGSETITGHYEFADLVVEGSLFINDVSSIESLNGIRYDRLVHSTLTFSGQQTLSHPINIGSGSVTSLTLAQGATINGLVATDLMYISGPQTVTGHHQYRQAGVRGDLGLLGHLNGVDLTSVLMLGQTLTVPSAQLTEATVNNLLVTNVNRRSLSDWQRSVLALDQPQTLSGHVVGHSAAFSDLRITRLNGHFLDDFLRTLWKSPNDAVAGITTLLGPVRVRDLAVDRVNGVTLTSDLLTTDTDQTVTSHLRMRTLRVTLDLISDSVNGLDLSRQVVRTAGTPNTKSGSVLFYGDLAVTGDVIMADGITVNGVDLSEVSTTAAGGRRSLHFSRSVVLSGDWSVTGSTLLLSINGHPLDKLDDRFWNTHGEQNINIPVTVVNNLTIKNNLTVGSINGASTDTFIDVQRGGTIQNDVIFLGNVSMNDVTLPAGGTLNGRDLSEFAPSVVTRDGDQLVTGTKVFSGAVQTAGLLVRQLNGLKLPEDVVLTDQRALQTGSLTFLTDLEVVNAVISTGDVDVLGSINGYGVKDILGNLTNVWVNRTTNHVLIIEGNVHFHDIHVVENVSSGGVLELLEGLLYKDRDTLIPGVFTVQGDVRFNSGLGLHTVNDRPWAAYLSSLILSDEGGTVSGSTTVTSSMVVTRPASLLVTSLNGYTLQRLYSQYLTLHTHQLIRHGVTIYGAVNADVLNVHRVNSVPVNQLMFTDRDVHFYQSVHFFSDVTAFELGVSSGVVDGCNLTQLWESGLRRLNASQTLTLTSTIDSLTVNGDVTLADGSVVGQLRTLLHRIVTKAGNHSITGEVTFSRPLAVTVAEVASYNGNSLAGLCEDALTTDMSPVSISNPLTLLGPVTFRGDVTVADAVTVGLLNGQSLDEWLASLVLQGDPEVILGGPLRIQQAAVSGHVLAPDLINGQPQSVWVERDSDITVSSLHFDRGLTVIDGLDVTGLVDGVNVTALLERSVDLMSDVTIPADIIFNGDVAVWMHLNAPSVNDLKLPEDLLVSYLLDRMQTVTGDKHFGTLVVEGGLCGRLNGVRPSQLCGELLSSAPDAVQVVTRSLVFQHRPANLEEPAGELVDNLTVVTSQLRVQKGDASVWMAQLRSEIKRIRSSAATLLQTPDYSVDMAYLLEVQRLPAPHATAVHSAGRDLRSLDVLLLSGNNCSLPTGCLCQSTNTLQVQSGGLLLAPGSVQPGRQWTFHVRDRQRVLTVTARADGDGGRCQPSTPPSVSISSRPAGDLSGPPSHLPLAGTPLGHISDVQLFSLNGQIYLVLAYGFAAVGAPGAGAYPATEVFLLDGYRWRTVQRLPALGATGLDLTKVDGVPHLLVVNRHSREPLSLEGEVQLWAWSEDVKQFSELRALYHADIQAVAFLHAHEKVFVVIADLDGLTVLEYSPDDHQYAVCQYLAEPGISAVTSFIVGAESYLVVFSTKLNELVVFQVTHQEGLKRHCWYPAAAVRSLAVYSSGQQLLLAAVHQHGLVVYRVVVRGRLSLVTTSAARLPPPPS